MEIALNKCFGGFGLSEKACTLLKCDKYDFSELSIETRGDKKLISALRLLGEDANGPYSKIKIITLPEEITDYRLYDYDGEESILYVLNGKIDEE